MQNKNPGDESKICLEHLEPGHMLDTPGSKLERAPKRSAPAWIKRSHGQAAMIVAPAVLLPILIVGLAIGGNSTNSEPGTAQSSGDAAALAGTSFTGAAADSTTGVGVMPLGLFTDTEHLMNLVIGQTYKLIDGDIRQSAGNWGWINFNGGAGGPASLINAWLDCGFNASIVTPDEWAAWCPSQPTVSQAAGPAKHYRCADHPDCLSPARDPVFVPYLKWGQGDQGWWLEGFSGKARSNCHDLETYIVNGKHYVVPIFDRTVGHTGGGNTKYHLRALARFLLVNTSVHCNNHSPARIAGSWANPTRAPREHWHVEGILERFPTP